MNAKTSRRLFLIVLLVSGGALGAPPHRSKCNPAANETLKSYFLPMPDKVYQYDMLARYNQGDSRARSITYEKSPNSDGDSTVLLKTVFYLGAATAKRSDKYSVACGKVYHSATESDLLGRKTFGKRAIIMVLPEKGTVAKWTWSNDGGTHEYTATLVDETATPLKIFADVLVVSDQVNYEGSSIIKKYYYAKGYGLVKEELLIDGKVSSGPTTNQLVAIE
jgi:hypothetical protein